MRKNILILFIFCMIFLCSIQNIIALDKTPNADSSLSVQLDSLKEQVKNLEERVTNLSDSLEKARTCMNDIHTLSIENTNKSLFLVQLLCIFVGALFTGGIIYWLRMSNHVIEKKVNEEVKKQVAENDKKFKAKLEELGIDQDNLKGQFYTILQKQEYHNHLFEIQSPSEDLQIRGITGFISKPVKDDLLVKSLLNNFENSRNQNLKIQSLRARAACGDKTAQSAITKLEAAAEHEDQGKE